MSDAMKTQPKAPTWKLAVLLGVTVILLWFLNLIVVFCWPERGTFGDMFGAVNALFTGLAFAAVIYAILIQRHEVGLLKNELDRSKEIMEEQQKLAKVQISAQQKQQFEATFFNLVRLFNERVDQVAYSFDRHGMHATHGRSVFKEFVERLPNMVINKADDGDDFHPPTPLPLELQPSSEELFDCLVNRSKAVLVQYFRTIYSVIEFVDQSSLQDTEKRFYTNLIRAQLSDDEAMLLFLNGLSERGAKFKPLLERYGVLKNVDRAHQLYTRSERKGEYAPSAFE